MDWGGDLREEDLNYLLIEIYTGSKPADVGSEIFRELNMVAARQGLRSILCLSVTVSQSVSLTIFLCLSISVSQFWMFLI